MESVYIFPENKTQTDFLQMIQSLWQTAVNQSLPAAVWRLPVSSEVHFIATFSGENTVNETDLEELPPGFLCHPFDASQGSHFIPADLHYVWENHVFSRDFSSPDSGKQICLQAFLETAGIFSALPLSKDSESKELIETSESEASKHHFTGQVKEAVAAIGNGDFQKVVLSRTKTVKLLPDFELLTAFDKLCGAYPGAFVSLVFLPEGGTWLGASPETLVSLDEKGIFRTMALAGTQKRRMEIPQSEVSWTQKEIEEQALVSRYIINCLKKIRVREFEEDGPRTVAAGNLLHLRTDFAIDTEAISFPDLTSVMLGLLHPTSAVCGMPKAPALDFIYNHETHDRRLYSGYLGPVNVQQQTHLFVNLRCMQVEGKTATLFAGAGITAHSQPEKEWNETELKCRTLLDVIG
jgi:isochorismate synthase